MRNLLSWLIGLSISLAAIPADAVEVAPRITDREIVERLTALEAGQKKLEAGIDTLERSVNQRIDGVERSLNARIDDLRADLMARFDLLTWLISLFVTIAMVTLGFVLRMQWQLQQRQTRLETSLETQKDEIAFLKSLIDKLLPPRTAL
jgi:hypothetical protein